MADEIQKSQIELGGKLKAQTRKSKRSYHGSKDSLMTILVKLSGKLNPGKSAELKRLKYWAQYLLSLNQPDLLKRLQKLKQSSRKN